MKIIDISMPLSRQIPLWPGSPEFNLSPYKQMNKGSDCNISRLACDVHTGTHIDAPAHFILNGATSDMIPLDVLIGPARVCHLPVIASIRAIDLENLSLPLQTKRLLLRTDNSNHLNEHAQPFKQDYVGLTDGAAQWIVKRGIQLIGVDYLSVASFDETESVHRILLKAGIVLLEGLNLFEVRPGDYELICLPLKLVGAEGAPARAVIRQICSGEETTGHDAKV